MVPVLQDLWFGDAVSKRGGVLIWAFLQKAGCFRSRLRLYMLPRSLD